MLHDYLDRAFPTLRHRRDFTLCRIQGDPESGLWLAYISTGDDATEMHLVRDDETYAATLRPPRPS